MCTLSRTALYCCLFPWPWLWIHDVRLSQGQRLLGCIVLDELSETRQTLPCEAYRLPVVLHTCKEE